MNEFFLAQLLNQANFLGLKNFEKKLIFDINPLEQLKFFFVIFCSYLEARCILAPK
jgi:hypothetical protein